TFESSQSLMEEPLPAYARSYVDSSASTDRPWYFVIAVDTAGNAIPSFGAYGELIDRVPPSKPTGLTGKIDTTGTVQLAWDLGPEEDIIGYRLLYANDPTHEFSTVTSMIVRDTVYTDSIAIKTLTKSIYYRIAAIDERHNQSEFSDLLKLERPDIVPPVPSVFSDVSVTDSTVTLEWNISPSKDLMRQVLYRRAASADASWDSLAGLSRTIRSYTDTAVSPNTRYRYRIQAVDSAGLRSKFASTVQARPYDTGIRKQPQLTSVDYDSSRKVIEIRWTYSDAIDEEYYFVIYRANGNGVPESYKALPGDQRQFTDRTIQTGKIYRYAVKVKMRSGAQSKLSTQREVNTGGQSP
ncbi:MAG: hypothetical protein R3211_01760, partial [Balneolaceae bacterium]|nr:hypothetical protein [Balneolaceae bacterium]